jgi:hypothetical protein
LLTHRHPTHLQTKPQTYETNVLQISEVKKIKQIKMEKLVFDYTYCSEPECWEWDVPFEYESKEKFIFDVLENPMILDKLGITSVYQFQIDEGTIFEEDYIKNIDMYVLTLDEWFDKNKTNPKQ